MPDEAAGCLVGFFRFLLGMLDFVTELGSAEVFGWIGRWTLRALTLGRSNRDSEDGLCVLTGLLLVIALITAGMWLF